MHTKSRPVAIEAQPDRLTIDLARTALLVIDMQNDFAAPGGMFDRAGLELSGVRDVVGPIRHLLAASRAAGIPVIHIRQAVSADLSGVGPADSPHGRMAGRLGVGQDAAAPDGRPSRIHIDGTWHTEILPELAPLPGEIVVTKRRWSGFHATELDATLRALGTQYLIVTGCTTSVCVESTIRDAAMRDYACLLPADCTAQPAVFGAHSSHDASLVVIARHFGWVTTSNDVLHALAA